MITISFGPAKSQSNTWTVQDQTSPVGDHLEQALPLHRIVHAESLAPAFYDYIRLAQLGRLGTNHPAGWM